MRLTSPLGLSRRTCGGAQRCVAAGCPAVSLRCGSRQQDTPVAHPRRRSGNGEPDQQRSSHTGDDDLDALSVASFAFNGGRSVHAKGAPASTPKDAHAGKPRVSANSLTGGAEAASPQPRSSANGLLRLGPEAAAPEPVRALAKPVSGEGRGPAGAGGRPASTQLNTTQQSMDGARRSGRKRTQTQFEAVSA